MPTGGRATAMALMSACAACDAISGLDEFAVAPVGSEVTTAGPGGSTSAGGSPSTGGMIGCPSDSFDAIDTSSWTASAPSGATWSIDGARLRLDVVPKSATLQERYATLIAVNSVRLTECNMKLEIAETTVGDELGEELYFAAFFMAADTSVGFVLHNGILSAGYRQNGVSSPAAEVPFDHGAHRWWRFYGTVDDGLVHFETSVDGSSWATLGGIPVPFSRELMSPAIGGGALANSDAIGGVAIVDNFNLP